MFFLKGVHFPCWRPVEIANTDKRKIHKHGEVVVNWIYVVHEFKVQLEGQWQSAWELQPSYSKLACDDE